MDLFTSALPELLGSLASALVLGVGTWLSRHIRTRYRDGPSRPVR
ncbi:hypothetical protein [Streptomyces sp. HUAS TT7]